TGAGSGIGRALSQALAREGMRIAAADVDEAGLAETIKGLDAIAVRTDVTDLAQVQALADRAGESIGAVHVLGNNAGVADWGARGAQPPDARARAPRRHGRRGGPRHSALGEPARGTPGGDPEALSANGAT